MLGICWNFNKSFHQESFPELFKMAYVIPISKTSSPKSFEELRPISYLAIFAKLFEKILESRMTNFMNKYLILTPSQYGFRENNSTELELLPHFMINCSIT